MADVMLRLGEYSFSIDTAAYQKLTRSTVYRWAPQERVGTHSALQFTGYGEDVITLDGRIYPDWRGGGQQIQEMRRRAEGGVPLMLVDGYGRVHGRWVIQSIDEQSDTFAPGGAPRRQQFTLQMRFYDDGPSVSNP